MSDVVVVESPAKAKTINKYLGDGYTVLASFGHVRDLPPKDGSVRPDDNFAMDWEADERGARQIAAIAKALKGAKKLYLATDPDRGLWRYTRHPNYFGDACMWWGLFGLSYGSPVQLVTVVSPLLMTFVLTRGTGQRMTDRRMAGSRPGFAAYAARTSGFIPLPPRRARTGS